MNNYQDELIHQNELIEFLAKEFGVDKKEEIHMYIQSQFTPKEWVPIIGTDLFTGISPAGGMMMCQKCDCIWSLNNYSISIPNANNEEEKKAIANIWQDSKACYKCPCCSYQSMRKR